MTFEVVPINGQTWLICGGRNFADQEMFDSAMSDLLRLYGCPYRVIHGGARGADAMAGEWAADMALDCVVESADWAAHGRAAGPIRNQAMLDLHKPHMIIAFPGSKGTADMIRRSRDAGIDVAEVKTKESPPTG